MSDALPPCPACGEAFTYEDRGLFVCPMCAHEWAPGVAGESTEPAVVVIKDSVGSVLSDGDADTIAKALNANNAGGAW